MNIRSLSLVFLAPLFASAQSFQTTEAKLKAELMRIRQSRVSLNEEERKIAVRIKELRSPRPFQTSEEALRAELAEIEMVRESLTEQEHFISARIKEVQAGLDTTKGVSNTCPAHKIQMRVIRAPIAYGMFVVRPTDPPREIRSREFPFALDYWRGGCVVDGYREAKIFVCPDCQRAEKQWKRSHSK